MKKGGHFRPAGHPGAMMIDKLQALPPLTSRSGARRDASGDGGIPWLAQLVSNIKTF